jgi:hypothetical protein
MDKFDAASDITAPPVVADASKPVPQPVHIVPEEAQRFAADDPAMIEHLTEHGYAVIKEVLSKEDIATAENNLWSCLEKTTGLRRYDPTTWTVANLAQTGMPENGILRGPIGQSDFLWQLRCAPGVLAAFASIFKTTDLISSMDGGNIFLPWHRDGLADTKTSSGWFHGIIIRLIF